MSTFRSLALTFALLGSAGASTLTYPATTVTLHERAADWQSAELSGLVRQGDAVTVPGGIGSGTLTSAPLTVAAFDQLVPSWNGSTGGEGSLTLEVRVGLAKGGWSTWYSFGTWSAAEGRTSLDGQKDSAGQVLTDTLRLSARATTLQYRVTLRGPGTALRLLGLTTTDWARRSERLGEPSDRQAWGRIGVVPQRSQMLYPGGGEAWCSPTSVSMILAAQGRDVSVPQAAAGTYDRAYDGTGNWSFNVAYAGEQGMRAFVTRLPSLSAAEKYTAAGFPLAVSLGWKKGELPGAPLPSSTGHLMVLIGFDPQGNPVLNDPAAPTDAGVRIVYPRAAFEKLWLAHSGGLGYVIAPPTATLP
ncbi:peptidase C39 family protein [Deinococcus wulumuqiensis]|uniref:Peptidase C39 family protein n=1 Tax=Deinococcus wulumuqiensis TaxID=980427 RepID=A0A345IIE0_9DEIO|nr:peptidase C39 family protein [Deinococcus wulumuqiensis]AXG99462.1 peptidase C39 family protein [Deinococcus wulumuqiensis]